MVALLNALQSPHLALPGRRRLLAALASTPLLPVPLAHAATPQFAEVRPRALRFPQDHGAHPLYRTEWWYLTGVLQLTGSSATASSATALSAQTATGTTSSLGIQVTFFRLRTEIDPNNPSRFAAQQLLVAHVAVADPRRGYLIHDQRLARLGFGIVNAAEHDTALRLENWHFTRERNGHYQALLPCREFDLQLNARPTQPLLLQGEGGWSQKGPLPLPATNPAAVAAVDPLLPASYYYSQPQLALEVQLKPRDAARAGLYRGQAWLDHEWSSTLLDPQAAGWDWIGMNLDDGSALTAFCIRARDNARPLYAYASLRAAGQSTPRLFTTTQVQFTPLSSWRSPRTGTNWPVAQRIQIGERVFETQPLMPDQELDSRATTGAIYWEGASSLLERGQRVGAGYLEMTGYAAPLNL